MICLLHYGPRLSNRHAVQQKVAAASWDNLVLGVKVHGPTTWSLFPNLLYSGGSQPSGI